MLKVEDIERIRRAYYVEKKSIRAITMPIYPAPTC